MSPIWRQRAPVHDDARVAAEREVGPGPLEHHDQPVPESDQVPDMDEHPQEPGEEPAELEPPDPRDCRGATDRRHDALVEIAEGARLALALQVGHDQ